MTGKGWDVGTAGGWAEGLQEALRLVGREDPSTATCSISGYLE